MAAMQWPDDRPAGEYMTGILAIDTATDACSVAVYLDGEYRERYQVIPRQHSQRLFAMLGELLNPGDLREQGIDAIAYSEGPGSFTGLRIAASAVQGLAYASGLPAIGISTLALQAQTALRTGVADAAQNVLSLIDARINDAAPAAYQGLDRFEARARIVVDSRAGSRCCRPRPGSVRRSNYIPSTATKICMRSVPAVLWHIPCPGKPATNCGSYRPRCSRPRGIWCRWRWSDCSAATSRQRSRYGLYTCGMRSAGRSLQNRGEGHD